MKSFNVNVRFKHYGLTVSARSDVLNEIVANSHCIESITDANTGEAIFDENDDIVFIEWCAVILAGQERSHSARSAWGRGVVSYVHDLCQRLSDEIRREQWENNDPHNPAALHKMLLNGARDWYEYSRCGFALVCDQNIAGRLCTPSELRRSDFGRKAPNARETWLDVQALALSQAAHYIEEAARVGFVG